jgi:hypothetical protein
MLLESVFAALSEPATVAGDTVGHPVFLSLVAVIAAKRNESEVLFESIAQSHLRRLVIYRVSWNE